MFASSFTGEGHSQNAGLDLASTSSSSSPYFEHVPTLGLYPHTKTFQNSLWKSKGSNQYVGFTGFSCPCLLRLLASFKEPKHVKPLPVGVS